MLAQNKDIALTWLRLFLACTLQQRHFSSLSQREQDHTSIHFFISEYSPKLKLFHSNLVKNLINSIRFLFLLLLFCVWTNFVQAEDIISTIAGTGVHGYDGEGVATSKMISWPMDVAVDNAGNLYIADRDNHRIRKVDSAGNISTVAGTGTNGYNGEGVATSKMLAYPMGVAVDNTGNLYIADIENSRIRKVDMMGIMTTIAGTGTVGYDGEGTATSKMLSTPADVAVDSDGNLYIADMDNHRIRKVNSTGNMTTIAGTGTAGYDGEGVATSKMLSAPSSVAVDNIGNLYIADMDNHRIRKVDRMGIITTVAGTGVEGYNDEGVAISKMLASPHSVAVDSVSNLLYIADQFNYRIRKVDSAGNITTVAGTGVPGYDGDGIATNKKITPSSITVDSTGNLFIADLINNRIRKVMFNTIPVLGATPLPPTMNLTIGFSGNGHGRVTTDPSGIDCDTSQNQTQCSYSFNTATWIKLKVAAAADSKFIRWSGNRSDCEDGEVFITNPTGCIAYFYLSRFPLTITTTGQGKVSSEPVGINCGNKCRYSFDIRTKVTLTATPNKGWQFKEWNNNCTGKSPQTIVTMDQSKTCTATFIRTKLPPTDFFYTDNQQIPLAVKSSQLGVLFKEDVDLNSIENFAQNSNMTFIKKIRENMVILGVPRVEDRLSLAQLARELKQQHSEIAQAGLVVEVIPPRNIPPVKSTPMIVNDEFIVRFKSNVSRNQIETLNQELAQQFAVEIVKESTFLKNRFLLKTTENTPATSLELSNRYKETGLTEYAHPNFVQALEFRSNDTLFGNQWYHENTGQQNGTANADIDTPDAWSLTTGNSNVVIAVIDDGFDMGHEDLNNNYWSNPGETTNGVDDDNNNYVDDIHGWNFAAGNNQLNPNFLELNDNHGTAVAGAIAAIGNNNKGIIGSCPNCKIMPLRIGNGTDTNSIAEAFGYARDKGAEIIVNAWGYPPNEPVTSAVKDAINTAGINSIVFFAMSNGNFDDCTNTTSSLSNVIAVSSSTNKDQFDQAGYGDCMDLLAPSTGLTTESSGRGTLAITTTDRQGDEGYNNKCSLTPLPEECYPSQWGEPTASPELPNPTDYTNHFGGTSFATALTAGVAGLILSADPTLTRVQVQNLLQDTADKIDTNAAGYHPNTGKSNTHGYGRVNAFEAVRVAAPTSINNGKGGVDIFLRDNYFDWGNTAQSRFPESVQSVDIKVDASPFSPPIADDFDAFINEIPEFDVINKVYLRVRNRGPNTANNVIVKMYWAQAKYDGTFPNLPEDFWQGNTGDWHSLNCGTASCSVNVEYSGSSVNGQIVTFDFEPIFNSGNPRKIRLLAIVDSIQDPPVKDQFNVNELALRDNNITYYDLYIPTFVDPCRWSFSCDDMIEYPPPDDYCLSCPQANVLDNLEIQTIINSPPDHTSQLSTHTLREQLAGIPSSQLFGRNSRNGERDDVQPLLDEQNYAFITTLQKSLAELNLPLLVLESNGKRNRLEVPLFNSEAAEIPQAWYSVWVGKTIEWPHENVPVTGIFTNQFDDVIYLVFQGKADKYYQSSLYPALHPEIITGLIEAFPNATLMLSEQGLITFTQDNETSQFRISYVVTPSGFAQDPLKIKPLQGDFLELSAHGKSQKIRIVNK